MIVVGAGIMGSCTAYQLAKRGLKTLLLEQFDFLHNLGSSHGESRTIRATYPDPYYYHMVMDSILLWEQAQSEIGYRVYYPAQQFDLGPSDDKYIRSLITTCQRNSLPYSILNWEQVLDKFSGRISIPEDWVGLLTEPGGVIKATKAVSMFQTLALKYGAVLRDNSEVKSIVRDDVKGGVIVGISNGEKFWSKKCVVTVGAWAGKLVKKVSGMDLPIQPLETSVSYWRIKEGFEGDYTIESGFPTFACSVNPTCHGSPSLEYPGLMKFGLHTGPPCDPDRRLWGRGVSLSSLKKWIDESFMGRVDTSDGPVTSLMCMYSMTPDGNFVIDYLGGDFGKDVVIGAGFSGHGFKMGPVVGRILADLAVLGEAKGVELKYFKIGRFKENPNGKVKEFEEPEV